jgi:hypothetical protein
MPTTYQEYTGDGATTDFAFSFPYLSDNDGTALIDVTLDEVLTTAYTIVSTPSTLIRFTSAPASNVAIRIARNSSTVDPLVDFANGSVLTETELDRAYLHNYYLSQEAAEGTGGELLSKKGGTHYDADGLKIINAADPDTGQDVATRHFVEALFDTIFNLTPTDRNQYDYGFIDGGITDASYDYGTL